MLHVELSFLVLFCFDFEICNDFHYEKLWNTTEACNGRPMRLVENADSRLLSIYLDTDYNC